MKLGPFVINFDEPYVICFCNFIQLALKAPNRNGKQKELVTPMMLHYWLLRQRVFCKQEIASVITSIPCFRICLLKTWSKS